jgi:hypothetical protein
MAALVVLLSAVWLGAFVAPASAWWGLPTRTFHPGGRLGLDSDLLSKSGLSAWAIDRYLAANTPLPPLGSAFMLAERRYGVNARYLVAHAMLESGFGTSDIARYAHNLFGYHAFDRDPWRYATRFRTFAGGILGVAKTIKRDYLVPSGRFWGGAPTLRGMYMYASDPNWDRKIATIAAGLDLATLSELGVRFGSPSVDDQVAAARRTVVDLPVDPGRAGALPAGVRFLIRFRPLAVREADPQMAQVARLPAALRASGFHSPLETDRGATSVALTVMAPSWPGRYAVDVIVRDTDGAPLPDANRLRIRSAITRVSPAASVSYTISSEPTGLVVRATNTGSIAIRPTGTRDLDEVVPAALEAWVVPSTGGSPSLVRSLALTSSLAPGSSVSLSLPAARLDDLAPGIMLVRIRPAGDGARPLGTPGVFTIDASDSGGYAADALQPADPTSARLLGQPSSAVTTAAPTAALLAAVRADATAATGAGPSRTPAASIAPAPKAAVIVGIRQPIGSVAADPSEAVTTIAETGNHATIAVDAVPAGGAALDALSLRASAPLPRHVAVGMTAAGMLPVPTSAAGPASYLAVGRIIVTSGGRTFSTGIQVFWLVVPGPSISSTTAVAAATHPSKAKAKPKPKASTHHSRPKPAAPRYRIHIVRAGETLWGIAHRVGWSVDAIRRLNPWVDRVGIHPGDTLKIPG